MKVIEVAKNRFGESEPIDYILAANHAYHQWDLACKVSASYPKDHPMWQGCFDHACDLERALVAFVRNNKKVLEPWLKRCDDLALNEKL